MTVAPAADPATAARAIAERVGGEIVLDVNAAERALALEASRRRARQVLEDAAEATRLTALLDGADATADRGLLAEADALPVLLDGADLPLSVDEVARREIDLEEALDARTQLLRAETSGAVTAPTDDAHALRVAAAHVRAARVAADAAERAVPRRPSHVVADIEVLRARALAAAAEESAVVTSGAAHVARTQVGGALAVATGTALLLLGASVVPVGLAAVVPLSAAVGMTATTRRRHLLARRAVAEAESCRDSAARAESRAAAALEAVEEWRARADAADAARDELALATTRWREVAGEGADVDDVERLCDEIARRRASEDAVERLSAATAAWREVTDAFGFDPATPPGTVVAEVRRRVAIADEARSRLAAVPAARRREVARADLRALLHGRRLDRLQAEAEQARRLVGGTAPRALVLCDPFAQLGPGRRRALLRDLERSGEGVAVAVVTSDEEALAWAEARSRA